METVTSKREGGVEPKVEEDVPKATVILVMQDGFPAIRRTVAMVAAQTIAAELELLIVGPEGSAEVAKDPLLAPIGRTTVVELKGASLSNAQAEGVRRAAAPVVILGEDHAWPEPGYAEALAAACRPPYAAVGPALVNANPDSVMSWANLLLAYGPWTAPVQGGPVKELPGTNSAYRREVLLGYGAELDVLMAREGGLLRRLREDGHELYLEPKAVTAHQNISKATSAARLRFCAGQLYAARRAQSEGWGLGKRAVYTAAAPLIPAVRFARILGELRRRRFPLSSRSVAGVAVGVLLDGAGQMAGYSFGPGTAVAQLEDFEFNRARYLSKRDHAQAVWEPVGSAPQ